MANDLTGDYDAVAEFTLTAGDSRLDPRLLFSHLQGVAQLQKEY